MTADQLHQALLLGFAGLAVVVFLILRFVVEAPYGRHYAGERAWWWGPTLPTRTAWVVMELPASLGFAVFFLLGEHVFELVPLVFFLIWQAHYVQRSFIYPFLRKVPPGDRTPVLIPLLAFGSNLGIAFLNATVLSWAAVGGGYEAGWLLDPRFALGVAVFATGYHINRRADAMLAALRTPGETGYRIPRGWLYEKISCPNYFGELLIWTGWAVATWSAAGAVFLLWTAANLIPRALAHHGWYREHFADYPPRRKAVIPGVL